MDQTTTLSLARIAVGAAAWLAPRTSLKAALLDADAPQSPYLLRLFGARDVALGTITLLAPPASRRALLQVGLAVDSADTGAALLALKAGQLKPVVGAVMAGAAGAAVLGGVQALGQQKG
ncbi:hypothetical protein [Nocardioides marmoribigeumensis]|uniref:DUF4267 domain-containing protein n=1 Tax=Nocardioides marmoribigeumensis TaxID=433649 RepID=A0ABU2BVQ4_9ACTN|nr:hypothetical protein [Nocardioides marmoribigeumensis]MDR7362707.1 hypothetical protein [Nocardioides marmoribigeumensis]